MQLPEVARGQLRAGEHLAQCTYSDLTLVQTGVRGPAECTSVDGTFTCGEGCEVCPMGQACRYNSERSPTGLCANTFGACGEWPTRLACTNAADACVRPIRGAVDGFTDAQRHGMCLPLARCRAIAARFATTFRCDETLVTP
ncbi:MAG: hypothetical protein Q8Q09_09700 [Deltaproteobacteria bacterium]|nr:hypothetical protein [Deltaproteobacteria bacterium]